MGWAFVKGNRCYTRCLGSGPEKSYVGMHRRRDGERTLRAHDDAEGLERKRVRGEMYDKLVDEFMREMRMQKPSCLVQFEDFGNANAFRVLQNHTGTMQPCFNDDIQGRRREH